MISAGAGLLLPCGVGVALQLHKSMARHVPHVGNARSALAQQCRIRHRTAVVFVIPKVDEIVVDAGVLWILCEHGFRQRGGSGVAADGHILLRIVPHLQHQKRARLDVIRELENNFLQRLQQLCAFLLAHLLTIGKGCVISRNPRLLPWRRLVLFLQRLFDELAASFDIVLVRQRQAPVGHRAVRVQLQHLPKRPLRLVIPKAVKLPHSLIKKLRRILRFRRHRKMHIAHPR